MACIAAGTPVAGGLLWVIYRQNPGEHPIFPPCAFLELTGFYCPGCGLTRALHYLLHGEIAASLAMNPLLIPLAGFVAYVIRRPTLLDRPGAAFILIGGIIGFAILRNIPYWPFSLLAPHLL